MAFKPKSAAETKARDLGLTLARIAEDEGTPTSIGVDRLRTADPRLTPLAVGQMVRRKRGAVEATLIERGLALGDHSDKRPDAVANPWRVPGAQTEINAPRLVSGQRFGRKRDRKPRTH